MLLSNISPYPPFSSPVLWIILFPLFPTLPPSVATVKLCLFGGFQKFKHPFYVSKYLTILREYWSRPLGRGGDIEKLSIISIKYTEILYFSFLFFNTIPSHIYHGKGNWLGLKAQPEQIHLPRNKHPVCLPSNLYGQKKSFLKWIYGWTKSISSTYQDLFKSKQQ